MQQKVYSHNKLQTLNVGKKNKPYNTWAVLLLLVDKL